MYYVILDDYKTTTSHVSLRTDIKIFSINVSLSHFSGIQEIEIIVFIFRDLKYNMSNIHSVRETSVSFVFQL